MDRSASASRFVTSWIGATIACAVLAMGFNILMDPYMVFGVPRIEGLNARKPAIDTHERMMKPYDVLRATPNTVILGTSRADWGIDGDSPAWPQSVRPVYNLSIQGGGPYTSYRFLQHLMSQRHLTLVVVALDFDFFLKGGWADIPLGDDVERRLAVAPDGGPNAARDKQRYRDVFDATVPLDTLIDSGTTLLANLEGDSSNIVHGNWDWHYFRYATAALGSSPHVALGDLVGIRNDVGRQMNPRVMEYLGAILKLCSSHGTQVILFVDPWHADMLEVLRRANQWQLYETWKRELVQLVSSYSAGEGGSAVELWDFSGYYSYSTEVVRSGHYSLRYFWDSSHYSRAMGEAIVQRLFDEGDTEFGVLLRPDTLETHLREIREQQQTYSERHPEEVRRIRRLYDTVVGTQTEVVAEVR